MPTANRSNNGSAARDEAERLIALAADMLNEERDQIARDHLGLALSALDRRREWRHIPAGLD